MHGLHCAVQPVAAAVHSYNLLACCFRAHSWGGTYGADLQTPGLHGRLTL